MSTWAKGAYTVGDERIPLGVAIDPANNYTYELQWQRDFGGTTVEYLSLVRRFYDTGAIDIAVRAQDSDNLVVDPEYHSGNLIICDPGDSAETTYLYFTYTQQTSPIQQVNVVKINGDGVIQWQKTFNGNAAGACAIDQDSDNIYLCFQMTHGIITGPSNIASIAKSDGSRNWHKYFSSYFFQPQGMVIDTANSVGYFTGYQYSTGGPGLAYDSKIIKFNTSDGSKVWSRELGGGVTGQSAKLRHPRLDSDGNLYVTTQMEAQRDFGGPSDSSEDILNGSGVMKINSSGTLQWAKDYVSPMVFTDMCILRSNDSDGADTIVVYGQQVDPPDTSSVDGWELQSVIGIDTDGDQLYKYDLDATHSPVNYNYWGGDNANLTQNSKVSKLLPDTNTGGFLLQLRFDPQAPAGSSSHPMTVLMRRNSDGTDTWNTILTGLYQGEGSTSYTAGSTSSSYTLSTPYTLSTDSGTLSAISVTYNNNSLGTFSTDSSINDYTINRYQQLENEDFVSQHNITNLVGFGLFGETDHTSQNQFTPLCNVAFDGIAPFSSDHQQTASAGNTVGFPDPGRYVDETYVTDSYVDAGFDADMTQRFNTRNIFSGLAGYKVAGIFDVDSDHQTTLSGGRLFSIDETLDTDHQIDLTTSVTQDADVTVNTDSQTSVVGGLALFGLLNLLSENNIFVDATNEIVPEANLLADAQFETTPGFLLSLGNVQYDADAQFTIDQTTGTTAGLIFDGSVSFDSDHILSGLGGLLVEPGTQTFTAQHQINVIAGYLKQLASSIASDHQTTMVPTILQAAAQAFMQSQHQIDITTGRILFTEFNNASDFQISIVGRRIEAADPYRAIEVGSETRIDIVVQETRIKQVSVETRVNSIQQESKLFMVPSETRNLKVLPDSTIKYRTGKVIAERI